VNEQTVTITSEIYGTFTVGADSLYSFPRGLVGLPEAKEYALIPLENTIFYILQAASHDLSFIVIPAHLAVRDYDFHIDDDTVELLKAKKPEDISTLLIVNYVDSKLYVNLKAPVLLSHPEHLGCQFIITDKDYPIRHPLSYEEPKTC